MSTVEQREDWQRRKAEQRARDAEGIVEIDIKIDAALLEDALVELGALTLNDCDKPTRVKAAARKAFLAMCMRAIGVTSA